jgi:YggT family protein
MTTVLNVLIIALQVYLLVLLARIVVEWVQVLARDYRPKGAMLVLFEVVYTLTDPPLRAIRKVVPPLRIGNVALDLGMIILFLVIQFVAIPLLITVLRGLS